MTNWPEYNKKLVNEIVDVFVNTDLTRRSSLSA